MTGHPALSHLARLAAVAFGASAAFLAAVDAGNALLLAGHVGDGTDDESAWTPGTARAAGVLGWVVQANGAVAIRDLGDELRARRDGVTLRPFTACLGCPIRFDGEVVGALAVVDASPRAWTEQEAALLGEVALVAEELVRVEGGRVSAIEARHDALEHERAVLRHLLGVERMLDALPFALAICDRTLGVTQANEAFASMLGIALGDVLGQRLDALVPAELVAKCTTVVRSGHGLADLPLRVGGRVRLVAVFPVAKVGDAVGRIALMLA